MNNEGLLAQVNHYLTERLVGAGVPDECEVEAKEVIDMVTAYQSACEDCANAFIGTHEAATAQLKSEVAAAVKAKNLEWTEWLRQFFADCDRTKAGAYCVIPAYLEARKESGE